MADTAEDFKMTDDEARRIKQALKDKEFMDLLVEYAKEISDPENKKKYEEEIVAMERQRGQDVRLLKPQSGFVIKTVRLSDNMKVFLNICSSPEVKEYELQHVKGGANLSLPHSVSPVREDIDKGGKACIVYDVCFNPKSYDKGMKESNFRQSMVDSAFDTIERQMNIKLDRKNKKFPKLKYKGQARPLIIRPELQSQQKTSPKDDKNSKTEKDSPLDFPYPDIQKENKATEEKTGKDKESEKCTERTVIDEGKPVVPKYKIVHRGFFEMTDYTGGSLSSTTPKELVVEIELPLAKSANGLDLDIFAQQLILDSEKPSYHLDISLPHKVDEDRGKAQFDKSKKVLIVTLPILKAEPVTMVPNPPSRLVEECVDEKDVIHNGGHSPDSGIDEMCNHHQNDEEDAEVVEDADECVFQPSDLDNAVFETKNFESMPMNAQLPQYSFDQTIESVVVAVKVPNVKVENISLGITHQQVCLSLPQDASDINSPDWSLVIRLDDGYYLEKDDCGFDILPDRMELNLKKKKSELWDRMFIGVSESSLKMEVFLVDATTSGIVEQLKALNVDKLPRAEVGDVEERKMVDMERRLEQLLNEEEKSKIDEETYERCSNRDVARLKTESFSEGSDLDYRHVDLMELADDVIDENSPLISPTSNTLNKHHEFAARTNRTLERSMSHDAYHPRLRSILKRSKSDGAANTTDTDDDVIPHRARATTYSDGHTYLSDVENDFSRRRNKSVSFQDEPIVFEFTKMTKWQWKRQELKKAKKKKSKAKNGTSSDQTASSADEEKSSAVTSQEEETLDKPSEEKPPQKHGRKWKKAQKKRNRNNSESRSTEEESEQTNNGQKKDKRKKKNKKNKNQVEDDSSNESKLTLSNPLIFQLD